ncbi:MAG TPA: hypothetical protein VFM46_11205, partial [Pseudomonadales bacterium]|nr:hypothetical protein [Pseudomonadales bacterium]
DDALNDQLRELAVIVNGTPVRSLDVSAQLLSRKAGVADDGTPHIDYAFATWHVAESLAHQQSLRLGRVKVPFGFFNETRESPFGRQEIFLPQSAYTDRIRNSVLLADELMYLGEWYTEQWNFGVKAGYGRSIPDKKELLDIFRAKVTLENMEFSPTNTWNVQASADYNAGRFRFAFSRLVIPLDFAGTFRFSPTLAVDLNSVMKTYMNLFSFEWNEKNFSFTTELNSANVNYGKIKPLPSDPEYRDKPEGGYMQLKWHATASLDLFGRYEFNYYNRRDKMGRYYAERAGIEEFSRFAYERVYGVTYRPADAWLIMAELHMINGTQWLTNRDMPADYEPKRHWNLAAVSVAWRF